MGGACWDPPVDTPTCQPKEIIVNGGFDAGMAPWTGPSSTGITSGTIITDPRSPPDSPNSLQITLPASAAQYYQFADIGQAIDICVNQRYRIRYSVRVERPNSYRGGCEAAVLVPGQAFVVQAIVSAKPPLPHFTIISKHLANMHSLQQNIDKQEYTDIVVDFTSDQGVVPEPMFWQSIVAPDGANGRSTVTFRIICQGGSTGGGLVRIDSISIAPI